MVVTTTSRIGMEMPNGKVKSIYCHYDGYTKGVGATLQEHYVDPEKVEALISLGDISQLRKHVAPKPEAYHSFDKPCKDVTVAYHRDRGEDFRLPRVDASVEAFSRSDIEEYGYVFTQSGEWKTFS
jgi:hypothetical protein